MWLSEFSVLAVAILFPGTILTACKYELPRDASGLPKPILNPPVTNLDEYLVRELPAYSHQVVNWTGGQINFVCKDRFVYEGYNVEDIEMFHVKYDDCYLPWVMCRHKDAWHTAECMARAIGTIPATMRQYIRHVVALRTARTEGEGQTYNDFDTIVLKGKTSLHSIFAEAAVSLGRYASMTGTDYWNNDAFLHAHASDTAVLNPISKVNQQNNFAQLTVVALVGYQHPGIWALHHTPGFSKIRNQVEQIQKDLGEHFEVMVRRGRKQCPRRIVQDSPVGRPESLPISPGKLMRPWANVQ